MSEINNREAWKALHGGHYQSGATHLPGWGINLSGAELTPHLLKLNHLRILEIGCGEGESVPYVLQQEPACYVGIDFSMDALKKAKSNYSSDKICFLQEDFSKALSLNENSFDEIFSVYGIGWSQDIRHTLQEIHRILVPGGTFTFSWDHYLARIVERKGDDLILRKPYLCPESTVRRNWNGTGHDICTFQAPPSSWFQLLREVGFEVMAFYEIARNEDAAIPHSFSAVYQNTGVPMTIIMQGKKPM